MVRNKHNFVVGEERDFPPVDIVPDQSLTINEILYNVSHGLPTGLSETYQEFDDDDVEPNVFVNEDIFDDLNQIMDSSEAVESEIKRDDTQEESSAPPSGKENTENEDEQSDV